MNFTIQSAIQACRRIFPRGWAPALAAAARLVPALRHYPARLADGSILIIDLRQPMCLTYLFFGRLPHEPAVETLVRSTLEPGSVFVDVGANVGYYTMMASRLVGPTGHVHAFEPAPMTFDLLQQNTRKALNVTAHPIAAGAREGIGDFYVRRFGNMSSFDPEGAEAAIKVRVRRLDDVLVDAPRVDLIKIDVEGFELEVLRGAERTLERHRPSICFELLNGFATRRGITLKLFEDLLRPFSYQLRRLGENDILAEPRDS